jgi:GNAT superfamily N-acetyltransferase
MRIIPFRGEHIVDAAELFTAGLQRLRRTIPALPAVMTDRGEVEARLDRFFSSHMGLAALDGDRLVGYLGWVIVDQFRGTTDRAAYCPVEAHAAIGRERMSVYLDLYSQASWQWKEEGCSTLALSFLAEDQDAQDFWFWNGFGLAVIDAIRPIDNVEIHQPANIEIRQACEDDAELIAVFEQEASKYYAEPPSSMVPLPPDDAEACRQFLADSVNTIWLAYNSGKAVGYMRFQARGSGTAVIVESNTNIAITAAYVRRQYRGMGASSAMLKAGLGHYRSTGYKSCSVDYESFNPKAFAFWKRYFDPVCYSVIRHLEA